ncbi:MAG TPA: hypothetical protein VGN37_02430 [Actinocatenispora sp.]
MPGRYAAAGDRARAGGGRTRGTAGGVSAMCGPVPKVGDVVWITAAAGRAYEEAQVARFRVIHADLIPGRTGWCRLRGWDLDAEPQAYAAHDVRVAGLVIRPGPRW